MTFQHVLGVAGQNLERAKEKFKETLLFQAEQWRQKCLQLYDLFMTSGPFHATFSSAEALEFTANIHVEMAKVRGVIVVDSRFNGFLFEFHQS